MFAIWKIKYNGSKHARVVTFHGSLTQSARDEIAEFVKSVDLEKAVDDKPPHLDPLVFEVLI